jgi:hypothetical protein
MTRSLEEYNMISKVAYAALALGIFTGVARGDDFSGAPSAKTWDLILELAKPVGESVPMMQGCRDRFPEFGVFDPQAVTRGFAVFTSHFTFTAEQTNTLAAVRARGLAVKLTDPYTIAGCARLEQELNGLLKGLVDF